MGEPIVEFESEKELFECLKEWQERLFLKHWIIRANGKEPFDGEVQYNFRLV